MPGKSWKQIWKQSHGFHQGDTLPQSEEIKITDIQENFYCLPHHWKISCTVSSETESLTLRDWLGCEANDLCNFTSRAILLGSEQSLPKPTLFAGTESSFSILPQRSLISGRLRAQRGRLLRKQESNSRAAFLGDRYLRNNQNHSYLRV